jgi:undecaprenyl-diphosphatase
MRQTCGKRHASDKSAAYIGRMWWLDSSLFPLINAGAGVPDAWLAFAAFASNAFPSLAAVALVGIAAAGRPGMRQAVARTLFAMAMAWLAAQSIRRGFPVPRPAAVGEGLQWLAHGKTSSFPSHHAAGAFACWWGMAGSCSPQQPRLPRLGGAALLLVALLITWSRVYLGLHFPTDVIAGAVLGVAAAALAHRTWARAVPWAARQRAWLLRLRAAPQSWTGGEPT